MAAKNIINVETEDLGTTVNTVTTVEGGDTVTKRDVYITPAMGNPFWRSMFFINRKRVTRDQAQAFLLGMEDEAQASEKAPASDLQTVAKYTAVDSTIIDRGRHYKVVKRWVATRTGNLRVSVENEHGLITTFGYPAEEAKAPRVIEEYTMVEPYIEEEPLPAPVGARDAIYAMDMASAKGNTVTQGHADYCRDHGHARYLLPGGAADQGSPFCPRCGDKTIPVAEAIEVEKNGPRRYEVFETICTGERKFLGTMHHYKASDEWIASKANGERALINSKLEYKGPERAPELALYVGWWN